MKKYFGKIEMTYKKVIILMLITSLLAAIFSEVSIFKDTSFRDFSTNLDVWILFAVFIIVNCKNAKEAVIKCFLFFLIGQPLIYLLEVPFDQMGWQIYNFYGYWFKFTLLTIPGSFIAYQIKRDDYLSLVVLSVANIYLVIMSLNYLKSLVNNFPNHLLSFIFCLSLALFFTFIFLNKKKLRIIEITILLLTVIFMFTFGFITLKKQSYDLYLNDGDYELLNNDEIVDVKEIEDNHFVLTPISSGTAQIEIVDSNGNIRTFYATINGLDIYVSELTD